MGYTFVHPKNTQRRYPGPGKDRRGNQEWVLEWQPSGSSCTDSYLHTKPHNKLQQAKDVPSQQCSQLKHRVFPLPICLALLGVQIQESNMCTVSGIQLGSGHGHQPHIQHLDMVDHLKWNWAPVQSRQLTRIFKYYVFVHESNPTSLVFGGKERWARPVLKDEMHLSFQVWMTSWSKWFRSPQINIIVKSQLS